MYLGFDNKQQIKTLLYKDRIITREQTILQTYQFKDRALKNIDRWCSKTYEHKKKMWRLCCYSEAGNASKYVDVTLKRIDTQIFF